MNPSSLVSLVISKVQELMEKYGTPKWKLGEVLGSIANDKQAKIDRANRFLYQKQKSVSIGELEVIGEFFNKPIEYFFGFSEKIPESMTNILASPKKRKNKGPKPLEDIADALRREGFNEAFINSKIDELKAMKKWQKES